ncbi:MAG: glutaredoxin [Bacteriovoracaceae bacterium]
MNPEPNSIYRKPNCPYGKKAVRLLDKKNVDFADHLLETKEKVEETKEKFKVKTTPQIFLEGERIGGYESLANKMGEVSEDEEISYIPVVAIFSVALLLSFATAAGVMGFMGYSLSLLAALKLMDLNSFADSFLEYDLIGQKFPAYAKIYPFAELVIGLGFLSLAAPALTGIFALAIGSAGGFSIYKAVYKDKKDLNCACVGGNTNVPLGAVSLSENAIMALMGLWLLFS